MQNRAARLDFSFPLEFRSGSERIAGHCLNVSDSGVLANFDRPLEIWTRGELSLNYGTGNCILPVRVARADGCKAGLAFVCQSDAHREALRSMMDVAERETRLVGRPPF